MGKLQDFLLKSDTDVTVTTEVKIKPFPFPFVVKSITERENKDLKKKCKNTTFDKRTRQRQTETDQDKYNSALVAECTVDPNFKDADLQAKYGVRGADALIDAMLKPGQFTDLLVAILEVNGFVDDEDINDLIDEAKNLSTVEETTA